MSTSVRAGTGASGAADAALAGRQAAETAVAALAGEAPVLVMAFTTPRYDLNALLGGTRSVTGDAHLIGGTGSGEMVAGKYLGFGAGVAVLALTAGRYRYGLASAAHIGGRLDATGQALARSSRTAAGPSEHAALLLVADSLCGDLQELFQGAYRVVGPQVPIAGGAAGDEQRFIRTFVFHDGNVLEEGAAALWIASDHPLHAMLGHGWAPIGVPLLVTRAEGTEIIELNGRPAAIVYEEQLGLRPGQLTADAFWDTSIHHPFGLLQYDGTAVIRMARAKTARETLIIQGCSPPSGSAVQVMTGTADTLLGVTETVVGAALAGQAEAGVVLTFSCAARAMMFGARAPEEAQRLQAAAGEVPIFGFCCCGEFARTSGVLGTHNATLTALAL